MKAVLLIAAAVAMSGCSPISITHGTSIASPDLEQFFHKHMIDGNYAVALKKRSFVVSYLATIHGYSDNLSVCEQLIEPYNKDASLSILSGEYYCEELR